MAWRRKENLKWSSSVSYTKCKKLISGSKATTLKTRGMTNTWWRYQSRTKVKLRKISSRLRRSTRESSTLKWSWLLSNGLSPSPKESERVSPSSKRGKDRKDGLGGSPLRFHPIWATTAGLRKTRDSMRRREWIISWHRWMRSKTKTQNYSKSKEFRIKYTITWSLLYL